MSWKQPKTGPLRLMIVANVVAARPGGAMTNWLEWDDDPLAFYPPPHVVYADANGN